MSHIAASTGPLPGLTFAQTLDRIFELLRRNLRAVLKLGVPLAAGMVVCYTPMLVVLGTSGALKQPAHTPLPPRVVWSIAPAGIAGACLMAAVFALFEAAATSTALYANVGQHLSFRGAYGLALSRCGRFLWLLILRGLLIGIPIVVPFALVAGLAALALHSQRGQLAPGAWFLLFPLVVLFYVAAILYAIWMSLRLALAPAACVAENLPATAALRRSGQLTRNSMGRIFLVLLVVYAAGYVAIVVLELGCMLLFGLGALTASLLNIRFVPPWSYAGAGVLAVVGAGILLSSIVALWSSYMAALAVLYHDQRYRTDGVIPAAPLAQADWRLRI